MKVREIKRYEITITLEDLKVVALVCLKLQGSDRKIAAIKQMREICFGMTVVDENGEPMTVQTEKCPGCESWNCPDAPRVPMKTPGLKECKEAVEYWFNGREFLG